MVLQVLPHPGQVDAHRHIGGPQLLSPAHARLEEEVGRLVGTRAENDLLAGADHRQPLRWRAAAVPEAGPRPQQRAQYRDRHLGHRAFRLARLHADRLRSRALVVLGGEDQALDVRAHHHVQVGRR